MFKTEATAVRRLELITGTGRWRQFSEDFKVNFVEETLVPSAVVSELARRNELTSHQVFIWLREARRLTASEAGSPKFVPAVVELALPVQCGKPRKQTLQDYRSFGNIEVEIEGVSGRIGRGPEAETVAAVLRALKASA